METPSRRRQFILWTVAISITTTLTLAAFEVILHVAARISPRVEAVLFPPEFNRPVLLDPLPDADFGGRGNPQIPGHDANGFRNSGVPDTTDIVAIGDSHTYGQSVSFDEAWPRVFETHTSCRVYSMAVGGYGPLQYAILAKGALRFKPHLMLVGIYFGNDFYDSWEMYLRDPSKYPVPKELLTEALDRERRKPLSGDVVDFFQATGKQSWSVRYFLGQNSTLWGFARAIKNKLSGRQNGTAVLSGEFRTAVAALTPKQLEYASVFEGSDWRTILTSRYREPAEHVDDPRISVGIWLTKWAIQHIDQMAKQNSIETIFILLPTKESVFAAKVTVANDHKYFQELTTEEEQIRQDLIEYMKKEDLAYIDMAPPLRRMVQQPYFEDANGHLNALGHKAIAMKLQKRLGACKP